MRVLTQKEEKKKAATAADLLVVFKQGSWARDFSTSLLSSQMNKAANGNIFPTHPPYAWWTTPIPFPYTTYPVSVSPSHWPPRNVVCASRPFLQPVSRISAVKKHHGYDWCERNPEGQGNMSGATLKPTMELGSHGGLCYPLLVLMYIHLGDHTVTTQANGVMLC